MTSLEPSCLAYTDKLLFALTQHGTGWAKRTADSDPDFQPEDTTPASFHFRVRRFYQHKGVLRGMIGVVEEPTHELNGYWLSACTRQPGCWNLTTLPTSYNLLLGKSEPTPGEPSSWHPPGYADQWPIWQVAGNPALIGFCGIAETLEHLEERDRRCMEAWAAMTDEEKRRTPEIVFERMRQALLSRN